MRRVISLMTPPFRGRPALQMVRRPGRGFRHAQRKGMVSNCERSRPSSRAAVRFISEAALGVERDEPERREIVLSASDVPRFLDHLQCPPEVDIFRLECDQSPLDLRSVWFGRHAASCGRFRDRRTISGSVASDDPTRRAFSNIFFRPIFGKVCPLKFSTMVGGGGPAALPQAANARRRSLGFPTHKEAPWSHRGPPKARQKAAVAL